MSEQEARAEAEAWLKRLDGDSHWARSPEQCERIDHERTILSSLLAAPGRNPKCEHGIALSDLCSYAETIANEPERVEAAPSDTDAEAALRAVVEVARGKMSDTEWLIAGREPLTAYRIYAEAILAAGFSRVSQPVQVEVTDEMEERAGRAMHGRRRLVQAWDDLPVDVRAEYLADARAALTVALGGGE